MSAVNTDRAALRSASPRSFGGRAFGLELAAGFGLPGVLEAAESHATAGQSGRRVALRLTDAAAVDATWPAERAARTFELPGGGGAPVFTIDREERAGYRVWIAGLGVCVVSPSGNEIACAAPFEEARRWDLLLGQGLPIAAALQGLEVLHASAVVVAGEALAFVAASGVGKTSLALELQRGGAEFLADDVVAIEAGADGLIAQPGLGVAHEFDAAAKRYVAVPVARTPAPLAAIYFLDRTPDATGIEIEAVDPPDPVLLLGATYVAHVPDAERLVTQLDICSRIATGVSVFRVRSPAGGGVAALAERVAEHAREVRG